MADYNVNMKQWNGTSFDNVLPLAYNAKQLGGQSLAEVKQWVQDNGLLLYTGQYTGTGTYGSSNPTTLQFPFKPILFIVPQWSYESTFYPSVIICSGFNNNYRQTQVRDGATIYKPNIKVSSNKISIYADGGNDQFNSLGATYYFAAIGGYDMGGQTEWTITSSGTWTVPRTGRYYIELYGGGGGAWQTNPNDFNAYQGGSSCQFYNNINLNKDDVISVSLGVGGGVSTSSITPSPAEATGTTFGSYSVAGGGRAMSAIGSAAGNLGIDGHRGISGPNSSNGKYGALYGYGGFFSPTAGTSSAGGPGAVYLKYLGA